eukprot:545340_1
MDFGNVDFSCLRLQPEEGKVAVFEKSDNNVINRLNKDEIRENLISMGFDPKYILRAFIVCENNYGNECNVGVMAEIISRLQKKDQAKLKRSKSIYAQSQLKHKHNNKRSQPVIAPPLHNASFEASTALNTPFISHMTIKDAHNLFFGAVIDHRDRFGRFMFARVVGRNG